MNISGDDKCAICLQPKQDASVIPELNGSCKHTFCQSCNVAWVKQCKDLNTLTCPLCRATSKIEIEIYL